MTEYWISWYSPQSLGGFELRSPWWKAGWMFDENEEELSIIVAAIRAESEEDAFAKVEASYFEKPENGVERRFCETFEEGEIKPWEREDGRFQLGDWMEW